MQYFTKQQKIGIAIGLVVVAGVAFLAFLDGLERAEWGSEQAGDNWREWAHEEFGFMFKTPPGMRLVTFREGIGYTVVAGEDPNLKESDANTNKVAFQMFVSPWDDENITDPTPQDILNTRAGTVTEKPQEALIGENGDIRALIFFGEDPAVGKTREVWFYYRAHLYQVFAPAKNDEVLASVFKTIKFK